MKVFIGGVHEEGGVIMTWGEFTEQMRTNYNGLGITRPYEESIKGLYNSRSPKNDIKEFLSLIDVDIDITLNSNKDKI